MAALPAPKFDYRPLGDDYGNFRLLELQPAIDRRDLLRCTIQHASIDTSAYCALSYVWGDQKVDSSEMETTYKRPKRRLFESKKHYQEGAVVYRKEIGSSLARALRYMRQPHACVVTWVDAFCIDQESKDERASQVKLMTKIYSSAQVVHAWLGPEYNEDPAVVSQSRSSAAEILSVVFCWYSSVSRPNTVAKQDLTAQQSVSCRPFQSKCEKLADCTTRRY